MSFLVVLQVRRLPRPVLNQPPYCSGDSYPLELRASAPIVVDEGEYFEQRSLF